MQDLKTWSKTHKQWVDKFVIELRTLEVPGPAIGDQLTTVYSHCQETGETPEAAFGDAEKYARSLGYEPKTDTGQYAPIVLPSLVTLLGMFIFDYAISAIANEHNFMLNWAVVLVWSLAALLVISLMFIPYRVLAGKPAVFMGFALCGSVLGIAGALFSRFDWKLIVDTNPLPVAIVSGLVMLVSAGFATRVLFKSQDDIVAGPLQSEEDVAQERRKAKRFGLITAWILPVFAFVSAVITIAF